MGMWRVCSIMQIHFLRVYALVVQSSKPSCTLPRVAKYFSNRCRNSKRLWHVFNQFPNIGRNFGCERCPMPWNHFWATILRFIFDYLRPCFLRSIQPWRGTIYVTKFLIHSDSHPARDSSLVHLRQIGDDWPLLCRSIRTEGYAIRQSQNLESFPILEPHFPNKHEKTSRRIMEGKPSWEHHQTEEVEIAVYP